MRNHLSTLSTGFTGKRLLAFLAVLGLGLAPVVSPSGTASANSGPGDCFDFTSTGVPAGAEPPVFDEVTDTYEIASKANLIWLSWATSPINTDLNLRNDALDSDYVQTSDIDLEGCIWHAIGLHHPGGSSADQRDFSGTYSGKNQTDGTNFVIDNLLISRTVQPNGFFGSIFDAVIEDLTIRGASTPSTGGSRFGLLAGQMEGDSFVSNVHVEGEMEFTGTSITSIGGLIGHQFFGQSKIERSSAKVTITTNGSNSVGGLVGSVSGATISQSFAVAFIDQETAMSGNNTLRRGGLVGEFGSGLVEHSYASGFVAGRDWVGGLVGRHAGVTIGSYARSDVAVRGSIENSADGTELSARAGGLVGRIGFNNQIENSFAAGTISSVSPVTNRIGGFGGTEVDEVTNVGPVFLSQYGNLSANFWDSGLTTLVSRSIAGTQPSELNLEGSVEGKVSSDLKSFATFQDAGWSIVDGWDEFNPPTAGQRADSEFDPALYQVWGICSGVNDGYPFLLWQYTSDPCGGGDGVVTPGSGANSNSSSTGSSNQAPGIHMDLQGSVGSMAASTPVVMGGQGLAPGSPYSLVLREPVTTLRSGAAGSDGRFSLSAALPATVAPGTYTLTLTATAADGSTLVLTQTFTVGADGRFSSIGAVTGSQTGGLAATGVPGSTAVGALSVATLLVLMGVVMMVARRRAEVVSS